MASITIKWESNMGVSVEGDKATVADVISVAGDVLLKSVIRSQVGENIEVAKTMLDDQQFTYACGLKLNAFLMELANEVEAYQNKDEEPKEVDNE
jgi:hypothetical protein